MIATVLMKDFPTLLLGTVPLLLAFETPLLKSPLKMPLCLGQTCFCLLALCLSGSVQMVSFISSFLEQQDHDTLKEMAIKACKKLPSMEFHHPSMRAATSCDAKPPD